MCFTEAITFDRTLCFYFYTKSNIDFWARKTNKGRKKIESDTFMKITGRAGLHINGHQKGGATEAVGSVPGLGTQLHRPNPLMNRGKGLRKFGT